MEHQTLFMTENLSTLVFIGRNCVQRKGLCRQHQHRGDDVNEGNNNDGAGLLEKEEGEKEVIVIATNK